MWETWREEMRHWEQQKWRQWCAEHEQRRAAEEEEARREAVERRQRIQQKWQRSGDRERDWAQRQDLMRQDRLEHPETQQRRQEWEKQRSIREQEVLTYPPLALRRHANLHDPRSPMQSLEPMAIGFGPSGDAFALWQHDAEGGAGSGAMVSHYTSEGRLIRSTPLPAQTHRRHVQPMPNGQVLLVRARCRRGEHNAAVYDERGELVRTAHLGDGIEHVLSTTNGAVWTGYFDEGVFAMSGLSTHGLVRFGPDLSPQWLYPPQNETDLPLIADCYALNVEGERAWICAYSDFHLVSAEGERAGDHGPAPVSGASALLVDGSRAALIGANEGGRGVITPLHLTSEGLQLAGPPQRLVLPDGAPMPVASIARLTSRGSELHVAVGATWYRFDLDDITAA